ncbi:hypothetical protein [Neotamlana nanhaiensis]|uniref:hypothetical protein n=1 Tax=Neotamlana nanhaiensis TaxID=1382798 RepID=UPI00103C3324|nr:hypothetical protein [Tamlana nanhaiensis]
MTNLTVILLFMSCSKDDNTAKLKIVNQTDCMHNIFEGYDSNSNYIGQVRANQIETIEIGIGEAESYGNQAFYLDPVNCSEKSGELYYVDLHYKETATIIID